MITILISEVKAGTNYRNHLLSRKINSDVNKIDNILFTKTYCDKDTRTSTTRRKRPVPADATG